MSEHRPSLFERLPALYRERDKEQLPPGQFEAYVGLIDEILSAVSDNIEALYHDHFIETCDDWVVPYIADLLGTSHLSGDPWTLRADVARTVHLRRRKGTLGALEALSFTLTGWAAHAVEPRERLVWTQHLNHQRPDRGGRPPLAEPRHRGAAVRHGTLILRHPGILSFFDGPFDPFAHVADLKPLGTSGFGGGTVPIGPARINVPNLAVYLWRLADYQVPVTRPAHVLTDDVIPALPGDASAFGRYVLHPLNRPLRLFNTHRFEANDEPPKLTRPDRTPGPMPTARLNDEPPTGNPQAYISVDTYIGSRPQDPGDQAVGLTIHIPASTFAGVTWLLRGADLCAWEAGLNPPLRLHEVVVDPVHGRLLFGLANRAIEGGALRRRLRVSHTYGFSGPSGAHPVVRADAAETWLGETPEVRTVSAHPGGTTLASALSGLSTPGVPVIVEIDDSMTHPLNLAAITDIGDEGGEPALFLARPLWIRAVTGQRPVIELRHPLRFRPLSTTGPGAEALMRRLNVRLEGLFITLRNAPRPALAILAQAAVNRLLIDGCTLDPAGHIRLDGTPNGTRQVIQLACRLGNDFGFSDGADTAAFTERPQIEVRRSIVGRLLIGDDYFLDLADSIVDGGSGVGDGPAEFAVAAADGDPELAWGPNLTITGMTAFGRMRVKSAEGEGGIWLHRLEVRDHQSGCIKHSYFSGDGDRLPPHHLCVLGTEAAITFVSHIFGEAGYGQLKLQVDRRILEQGPAADAMGAFGYLLNTHKWKNLTIRYREFMPVGVRPVLVPVT
jgi:hypothetical protein